MHIEQWLRVGEFATQLLAPHLIIVKIVILCILNTSSTL